MDNINDMRNRRKGLGIALIMSASIFSLCNDFWDSINEPKKPTIIDNSLVSPIYTMELFLEL